MNWSWLPNLITTFRLLLLIPLSIFLLDENYFVALVLFIIAGFSDALDGFLAKKFSWVSRFGAIMDPLADKALLVLTMALLTLKAQISWFLFSLVAFRDLYIIAGAFYYHYRLGPYEMAPSMLSKTNTFVQLLLVTSLLFSLGYQQLPSWFLEGLVWLTLATTLTSGIHYTWVWGRKLKLELRKRELSSESAAGKN